MIILQVWPPTWFDSYGVTGLTPGHQCWADGGTEVREQDHTQV